VPTAIASTNANGLKAVELATLLDVGRSTITGNVNKDKESPGHFRQWSQKQDPGGVAWSYLGDGNNRRFYRC
jgi:hypothetical protein